MAAATDKRSLVALGVHLGMAANGQFGADGWRLRESGRLEEEEEENNKLNEKGLTKNWLGRKGKQENVLTGR